MEIFNNQQRPGYEEIVSYGPKWWTEFREMDAVYRYAGWTLDLMAYWLERVVNNQFPAHADIKAIAVFEKILGITPDPDETLDERRRTVAAYYSGTGKLSRSVIQSIVKSYTGCDSDLWWNEQTLEIRIQCNEKSEFSQKKVYSIIDRRIPAHIPFNIRDILCVLELYENFENRVRYQILLSWWDNVLDGRYALEGLSQLSATFPPFFAFKLPYAIQNTLKTENTAFGEKFRIESNENTIFAERHTALFNWWEDFRTLDGNELLDGSELLSGTQPPDFTAETYCMNTGTEENFVISMYIPGNAKLLDGSAVLDGSINLNYGREEL